MFRILCTHSLIKYHTWQLITVAQQSVPTRRRFHISDEPTKPLPYKVNWYPMVIQTEMTSWAPTWLISYGIELTSAVTYMYS